MVDAEIPSFFEYDDSKMINKALKFIHEGLTENLKVLVHCNKGFSRAPGIVFIYLIEYTNVLCKSSFEEVL